MGWARSRRGWSSNANQLPESYAGNERGHEGFCFLFQQCEVRARHAKKTMTWRLDVCYQGCIGALYFLLLSTADRLATAGPGDITLCGHMT